jgi:hypothetical protein
VTSGPDVVEEILITPPQIDFGAPRSQSRSCILRCGRA